MLIKKLTVAGFAGAAALLVASCASDGASSDESAIQNAAVADVNPCTPESSSWCHLITDANPITGFSAVRTQVQQKQQFDVTFTLQNGKQVSGTCNIVGPISGDTCDASMPADPEFINGEQIFAFSLEGLPTIELPAKDASAELNTKIIKPREGGGYQTNVIEQTKFTNSCDVTSDPINGNTVTCVNGQIDYTAPEPNPDQQ